MTFDEFIKCFETTGMYDEQLILPGGSMILVEVFKSRFEIDYNPDKPYQSLSESEKTTPMWQVIWDKLKEKGILN